MESSLVYGRISGLFSQPLKVFVEGDDLYIGIGCEFTLAFPRDYIKHNREAFAKLADKINQYLQDIEEVENGKVDARA